VQFSRAQRGPIEPSIPSSQADLQRRAREKNEKIGELERENLALRKEVQGIKDQVKLLGQMISKRKA
jgi:hypothetical protein